METSECTLQGDDIHKVIASFAHLDSRLHPAAGPVAIPRCFMSSLAYLETTAVMRMEAGFRLDRGSHFHGSYVVVAEFVQLT